MKNHRSKEEGLRQNLKSKLQTAVGNVIGPPCLHCGEAIDCRSHRNNGINGNVSQGWLHEECRPFAEKAERDLAEVEPAVEEVQHEYRYQVEAQ